MLELPHHDYPCVNLITLVVHRHASRVLHDVHKQHPDIDHGRVPQIESSSNIEKQKHHRHTSLKHIIHIDLNPEQVARPHLQQALSLFRVSSGRLELSVVSLLVEDLIKDDEIVKDMEEQLEKLTEREKQTGEI
ncbi:hypothetical protein Tco_0365403 [Tanacetum coccineum]